MRPIHLLLFLISIIAFGGSMVSAQVNSVKDETIKIETRLVSIPTVVSDRNGRYIPNLTKSDFIIFQDGVEQKIEFFASAEEPINVALLIDTSQSTRPVLDDIKESARSFLKLLTPKDKAMIVSFDYDTHVLSPLTSDMEVLKRAIRQAEIPDRGLIGTTMRDAVHETVTEAFRSLNGRKAIILLTDGKDVDSRIGPDALLYSLQESDTLVYTVMFETEMRQLRQMNQRRNPWGIYGRFPPARGPDPGYERRRERIAAINRTAAEFLQELSETTAGRFAASKDGKLKNLFASIIDELRFQYRLGFYPPEETGEAATHQLKVKVNRPDSVVRARNSYRTSTGR